LTTIGEASPVPTIPPGLEVTVYEMIGEPFADGAANETLACPFPGVATTVVGASGTVAGTTVFDDVEEAPTPTAFVAVTVNV
jgi:hypothetical protein